MKTTRTDDSAASRDPITGAPGSHPFGTGLGAAAGGMAAGVAAGTVAGPVGTLVGAAAGAIIGGLAGKAAGEAVDPTATTFRLDPAVQAGLALRSEVEGRPQNQLVNEAVREWLDKRTQEVAVDLGATLDRLRVFPASDPSGERSMEAAMQAEAAVEHDPAQGVRIALERATGPASARMLDALSG